MKLEEIGFYTLSNDRVKNASHKSKLARCELVLTARCNFNCPYCRNIGGDDLPLEDAINVLNKWVDHKVQNIRFSGGEPTIYPGIFKLCRLANKANMEHIAISTNGSAELDTYKKLINYGVNDFSVSLDACCSEDTDKMTGGIKGVFDKIVSNIKSISSIVYTTVGVVLTDDNIDKLESIVKFADTLGVADIRIIPAAQNGDRFSEISISDDLLEKYPILKYRVNNIRNRKSVRGLCSTDPKHCGLVLDDMAVNQGKHYPCIIYLRESGKEIGSIDGDIRQERKNWFENHNIYNDPICRKNCLDVCVDYNRKFRELNTKMEIADEKSSIRFIE